MRVDFECQMSSNWVSTSNTSVWTF